MEVTLAGSLLLTVVVVLFSLGGLLLARRWILADHLKTQHDVTDPLSQVVGMMFAVLLGFMVGDAMQRFSDARAIVQQEAASLGDVFRLAEALPAASKDRIRALCLTYAEQTVNDEWPRLTRHEASNIAWQTYRKLWKECTSLKPADQAESNVHQVMLNSMVSLSDNHRMRIEALHNGLPMALWVVLVIGGTATIIFTYFFAAYHFQIQMIMVSMVSLVICLNIFLLASYDDPFSGDVKVAPTAFEMDIKTFKSELNGSTNEAPDASSN